MPEFAASALELVATAVAWIENHPTLTTALVGLLGVAVAVWRALPQRTEKRNKEKLRAWSGNWTNEGDCAPTVPETHFMDLQLDAKDRGIQGVLSTRKLDGVAEWKNLSIHGRWCWGRRAKIDVVHVRLGQRQTVARVRLRLSKDQLLSWRLGNGVADFFPDRTSLWRME